MGDAASDDLALLAPLLEAALTVTGEKREQWLAALRQAQPDVARRLEALMADEASLDAARFLVRTSAPQLVREAVSNTAALSAAAGRRMGAYTLERELGEGGMGSVWLARRSDGRFEGVAALKLPHLSRLSTEGARRFAREGNALARLTHPNIARLTDAGVAEDGQPFLVLEYVDGDRIDHWCDARKLSAEQRLELFQQVLAAVAHAHATLLVHRDLKPSNILVTSNGTVKLLDFGIVKLLEAEPGDEAHTELTGVGGGPLTPEYAAPEQVSGGTITTATDVYALGVLLYRLLAGQHPTANNVRGAMEVMQAVVDTAPRRLSTVITREAAQQRSAPVERLQRLYAGDLEVIVAKALEKEPAQRYASVTAFSEDIARFLRHVPVHARPASAGYRFQKFVRRNRVAVSAALLMVASLGAATAVTARQSVVARQERDEARRQRDRAVQEERRATAANGFLQTLMQAVPTGEPFTPATLLLKARTLIEADYATDPRFAARMLLDLAASYEALDDATAERTLLERARTIASASGDAESEGRALCALSLWTSRDPDSAAVARPFVEQAVAATRNLSPVPASVQVPCLMARARIVGELGPADSAIVYGEQALAVAIASGDTSSATFASLLSDLTDTYHNNNRIRDAYNAARRWEAALERSGRGSSVPMLRARQRVASDLRDLGEMQSADSALQGVLMLAKRIDSTSVPSYVTVLAGEVARQLLGADSAARLFQAAVVNARKSGDDFRTRWALANLANSQADAGQPAAAQRTRDEFEKAGGLGPGSVAMIDARIDDARGQPAKALTVYLKSLAERDFPFGRNAPPYHRIVYRAARAALAAGDGTAADTLAGHAIRLEEQMGHLPARSADIGLSFLVQGRARALLRDTTNARLLAGKARQALQAGFGVAHPATRDVIAFQQQLVAH
jgi:eukaryotic-like serine/threonine-protein kinase